MHAPVYALPYLRTIVVTNWLLWCVSPHHSEQAKQFYLIICSKWPLYFTCANIWMRPPPTHPIIIIKYNHRWCTVYSVVTPRGADGCLMLCVIASPSLPHGLLISPWLGCLLLWDIVGSLWPRFRPQSPLRILSDAPKFRAECLQTLRDGEVEEESAAPPSTHTPWSPRH